MASVVLEGIKSEHVGLYWPHIEKWVDEAVADAGQCWTSADVRNELENSMFQLWVIWLDGKMYGCICTHVFESTRGKTCAMPVVFCYNMDACIGVIDTVEAWAKSIGCVRLQGEGRAGWERALKPHGWRKITTQVEKAL